MTKSLSPNVLAWLLPTTMFVHQLEEYFAGFLDWYPTIMNAELSREDFLFINSIALLAFTLFAIFHTAGFRNNFVFMAVGTLSFANGTAHLLATIFTMTYSPGAISGVVLFLPLGRMIYLRIYPELPEGQKIPSIVTGVLLLFSVSMIARSMATS